jgi:hypothetical protein
LLDDHVDTVRTFVKWIYTGTIEEVPHNTDPVFLEKLWVYGDMIRSPKLLNCVIDLLTLKYMDGKAPLEAVKWVANNVGRDTKLRKLLVDSIASEGPLHKRRGRQGQDRIEWMELVSAGGPFVLQVVLAEGFIRWLDGPYMPRFLRHQYLIEVVYPRVPPWVKAASDSD